MAGTIPMAMIPGDVLNERGIRSDAPGSEIHDRWLTAFQTRYRPLCSRSLYFACFRFPSQWPA